MARHIRAADVDGPLAYGGYEPSEFDPTTQVWEPGYRVVQAGRRRLHITRP